MTFPILRLSDYLIAGIKSAAGDQDLLRLRDELTKLTGEIRARGVVVDLTGVDVMDSFATRTLRAIACMTKLRGAETVIVGIQPDVRFVDGPARVDFCERADRPRSRGRSWLPEPPSREQP
jgi:rsbT antagonist protein RsbS